MQSVLTELTRWRTEELDGAGQKFKLAVADRDIDDLELELDANDVMVDGCRGGTRASGQHRWAFANRFLLS